MIMKNNNKLNKESTDIKKPRVSVIVATYRRDTSLRAALISLKNQTYSNIEIVVVNDNSDETWSKKLKDIVNEFTKDCNIQLVYIENAKNEGSASTRNIGIKNSTGEYITFLDDDDVYLPNKIKNQLEHMIKNQSDYSITDLCLYNEEGSLIERRNRNYIQNYHPKSLERYHLMHHITGTDALMFKKNYLLLIGGFPSIDVGDEFYLVHEAIKGKGKFSYLNESDIKAVIHTKNAGLSSGDGKIIGENKLYDYKKGYFDVLKRKEIRYVKMRHYATLAYAEFRRERFFIFFNYSLRSILSAPIQGLNFFFKRRKI